MADVRQTDGRRLKRLRRRALPRPMRGGPLAGIPATVLTAVEARVLAYIDRHQVEFGRPPRVREICRALGWSSPNAAHSVINRLREKGFVESEWHKTATYRVVRRRDGFRELVAGEWVPVRFVTSGGERFEFSPLAPGGE